MTLSLSELIIRHREARSAWELIFDTEQDVGGNPQWDVFEAAEEAVLNYPCETLDDVRRKAQFVLSDDSASDTVRNCYRMNGEQQVWCLTRFLRSLLGEPVDNGDSGDKP